MFCSFFFRLVAILLWCYKDVLGSEVRITSASDFLTFINNVNNGKTYSRTTVYLDSDLSFSGYSLDPIGKSSSFQFHGVFNGQGHIISNLVISSSSLAYVGLFGYSDGLTIKNVVLDSSCSVTSSYSSSYAYTGGIIGECYSSYDECLIENCVNMAKVTFNGGTDKNIYAGGIAGYLNSLYSSYKCNISNCANYGSIVHSGTCDNYGELGGIAGFSEGYLSSYYNYIQNCLNYGTIEHNGISEYTILGGIVGNSYSTKIHNCLSSGKITMTGTSSSGTSYIGGVVGEISDFHTHINYCYFTNNVYVNSLYDTDSYSPSSTTGSPTSATNIDSDLMTNLNTQALRNDWNKWVFNPNKRSATFKINDNNGFSLSSQVILLPDLANEGVIAFDGWYTDNSCTSVFTSRSITMNTVLYGKFEENTNYYTISFDTRGGTYVEPITAQFGTTASLPRSSTKNGCTLLFWENEYGDNVGFSIIVPAHNTVLYAVWGCTRITTPDDFIDFVNNVNNNGWSYSGTTVYLESDLSFSGYFSINPIGTYSYDFRGVFNGQGHVISNLAISSSSLEYVGLFGYSDGLTISNVVFDSSCSITSSYSDSHGFIGGLVGECYSKYDDCLIENCVNMAKVTFNGGISDNLYIGGIAGYFYYSSSGYKCNISNCANYGSIVHSGKCGGYDELGGIAGCSKGFAPPYYSYVKNCLNYGTITHSGTSEYLILGGIVGVSCVAKIQNCFSSGEITMTGTSSSGTSYKGGVVGEINDETHINYCYFTNDVGVNRLYSTGFYYSPSSTTGSPTSATNVDSYLITNLNTQASKNDWNKWVFNPNKRLVTFKINDNNGFSLSSQVILLPDHSGNSYHNFEGWYTDPQYQNKYSSQEVSSSMTLYGFYGTSVNVFFYANGGIVPKFTGTVMYNCNYSGLPTPVKKGYAFVGWHTEDNEKVTSETIVDTSSDHILIAQWTIGKYNVTFDFGNGTKTSKILTYKDTIEYPDHGKREGYFFSRWSNKHKSVPGKNITIKAKWINKKSLIIGITVPLSVIIVAAVSVTVGILIKKNYWRIRIKIKSRSTKVATGSNKNNNTNNNNNNNNNTNKNKNNNSNNNISIQLSPISKNFNTVTNVASVSSSSSSSSSSSGSKNKKNKTSQDRREHSRFVAASANDSESSGTGRNVNSIYKLYPSTYARPEMKQALMKAKLTESQANDIVEACTNAGQIAEDEGKLIDGLTKDDVAAIAMYTYDFGDDNFESNPYRIINKSLAGRDYSKLLSASGILYLVMTALRKLPRVTGRTLYRGIRDNINVDEGHYQTGNTITWPALSSTSPDVNAIKAFLDPSGSGNGEVSGTMFIIDNGWGYNVQPYSLFPDEAEILLEPGREFEVTSVIPSADFVVIHLTMKDTAISLPQVFGDGKVNEKVNSANNSNNNYDVKERTN